MVSTVAIGASSGNVSLGISSDYYCTANLNWRGRGITKQDCKVAIELLYLEEVTFYGDKDFEFLSARAHQRSPDSIRTPRKYTVGECMDSQ